MTLTKLRSLEKEGSKGLACYLIAVGHDRQTIRSSLTKSRVLNLERVE